MLPGFGPAEGLSTDEVEDVIIEDLRRRELLVDSGRITHRYPTCWRCGTPLVFRVVDDWFIACDEIRQPMLDANATVEWTPDFYSKRMDDWLRNMGDWNISRKRYFGLPLPFYPCDCGELNVIGSRAELEERATAGIDELQELHRPWIDEVTISCASCGKDVRRIPEVGDAWLDAGIVPFSTLGWQQPGVDRARLRDRRGRGPVRRRPARPRVLGAVVPGGLDLGDARADPALVLLDLVHVDDAHREDALPGACSPTRSCSTSTGARCTAPGATRSPPTRRSIRWARTSCAGSSARPNPGQNIKFGYGPAHEVKRRLLTLWNSVKFFVDYANVSDAGRGRRARAARPLARVARRAARRRDDGRVRALLDAGRDRVVRVVRRRPVELVHPPVAAALLGRRRGGAQTLRPRAPEGARRDRAGDAVSGRASVASAAARRAGPSRSSSCRWPEAGERDEQLLAEVAETRRVVDLGRQARAGSRLHAAPAAAPARRPGRAAREASTRTRSARSCASRRSSSARWRRPSSA